MTTDTASIKEMSHMKLRDFVNDAIRRLTASDPSIPAMDAKYREELIGQMVEANRRLAEISNEPGYDINTDIRRELERRSQSEMCSPELELAAEIESLEGQGRDVPAGMRDSLQQMAQDRIKHEEVNRQAKEYAVLCRIEVLRRTQPENVPDIVLQRMAREECGLN